MDKSSASYIRGRRSKESDFFGARAADVVDSDIDEFDGVHSGVRTDGAPNWENRKLSTGFIESNQNITGVDKPFLMLTLVILLIGVIMVLSASYAREYYTTGEPMRIFTRQLVFAVSGVAMMLLVSRIKVRTMSRWSTHLLLVSIVLLVLVLVIGNRVNGAKRWIGIGGPGGSFTFQPSEIAKVAIILSFAQIMCKFGKARMRTFKFGVIPFAVITVIVVALLGLETHLSAAIIVTALAAIMMFAGGTKLRWFLLAGLIAASIAGMLILMTLRTSVPEKDVRTTAGEQLEETRWGDRFGYAGRRIDAWLNPDADPLVGGFQTRQSILAVGSGGLLGQGLGQSRQKYLYLPEEHNDYIFAIVCEELGFIGAMLILMLFSLLIIRGFWLALHAKDKYSSLITTGITSLLAIQVFLNVAVVTNLVPATGISLPFFSYGGTALWIQLVQMGIILAVSREIPLTKFERRGIAE
jgi:cell division protein FtsW